MLGDSLFQSKKATYNYWPVDNSQAEPEKLTVQPPADVMTFQDLKSLKEIVNEACVRDVVNKYLVDDEMDEEELTKGQIEQKTRKLILELKMLDEANETGMDSLLEFTDRDQFLLPKQRNFASIDLIHWPKTSKRVIQDQDTLDWVEGHITQWFLGIELRGLDEQEED
ncbi:9681_t:CDS:2 [Paraglomus brasilianum]|uniref:9681_t:CDS:1 n=1 Tax=Paraglomus brasilianum TaxID=144538 RepID=A0A9N8WE47_9GLOM|nr:9681_t:CDS:2 [Paraglomus brasilianum]